MCKAWDDHAKEYAKEQEIKMLIETSLDFNATKEVIIDKLCHRFELSEEAANNAYNNFISLTV